MNHVSVLHGLVEKSGFMGETFIGNSLINSYAKCGSVVSFLRIFHLMKERDVLSWTSLISGLSANGLSMEALTVFKSMITAGISPDGVTFVAVLSACSHSGLVEEGLEVFELMQSKFGVSPELKHYGCMVDLFSRAGLLRRALDLMEEMPMGPSLAVLGALLSACRDQGEIELAETVGRRIMDLGSEVGGGPTMLSGIYASEGRWDEAEKTRKVEEEEEEDLGKHSGQSWIEVEGVVYRFMVRDGTKAGLNEIVSVLNEFVKEGCF